MNQYVLPKDARGLPIIPQEKEPPQCERTQAQVKKLMDMSVEFRAEIYKFDLMCRSCNKCIANNEVKP